VAAARVIVNVNKTRNTAPLVRIESMSLNFVKIVRLGTKWATARGRNHPEGLPRSTG
jgi:hypothetical protein